MTSLLLAAAIAVDLPAPKSGLSIERLVSYPIINGRSPSGATMSPDGKWIVYGTNKDGSRMLDMYITSYPGGEERLLVKAQDVPKPPRQDDSRTDLQKEEEELYDGGFGGYQWSPGSDEILTSYRGRVWRINPQSGSRQPLIDTSEQVSNTKYSPDGEYIAFQRGPNVFRLERETGQIRQLTYISKPNTSLNDFEWSPDSKTLAVAWDDSSKLGRHVMMDFSKDRAEVVNIRRMWHGEMSQSMQIGFVDSDGGLIEFVEGLPRYMWMTSWAWAPDSSKLAAFWIDEDFQSATISVMDREGATRLNAYTEEAPSNYIPDFRNLFWSRDSQRIYFTTDILDGEWGNRSLLSMTPWGTDIKKVFAKNYDIAAAGRPKDSDRLVLTAHTKSPLELEIIIQDPGERFRVYNPILRGAAVQPQFDDSALPMFSDDGHDIATLASGHGQPRELYAVIMGPNGMSGRQMTESTLPEFEKVEWADFEEVTFKADDGETIYATLITKKGLDKSRKHPLVISNMYANSGRDQWSGYVENYLATELDMVVMLVNFRSSYGQGGEFNSGYHESMGIVDAKEAVKAKEFAVRLGYVDPDRCGVWGWSYGGFLTCMIQLTQPGHFKTGVAVASVTDWNSYNEWYTRRRLGLQSKNADVYKATSPVHHAAGLEDNLMLIHGMLDPNVLYQDTVRLQENLIKEGKYFDTFEYPRGDHGMWRQHERPHVFGVIVRHLWEQLGSS